jgi:heme/copper-type cytochrome/quinol oxidase subunit 2
MILRSMAFVVALCVVALPNVASACSVCFGDPTSPASKGLAWGVFALLGVVLLVLGGFTAFFIFLARRAAAANSTPLFETTKQVDAL